MRYEIFLTFLIVILSDFRLGQAGETSIVKATHEFNWGEIRAEAYKLSSRDEALKFFKKIFKRGLNKQELSKEPIQFKKLTEPGKYIVEFDSSIVGSRHGYSSSAPRQPLSAAIHAYWGVILTLDKDQKIVEVDVELGHRP